MERIQGINPERIAWCCADRGVTPAQLASETGISKASIDRAMAGEASLTFNQLSKIAQYFGRGVLFFLEAAPVDDSHVHSPQFRTIANQKPELSAEIKGLIERVEKQRLVYLSLLEDMEDTERMTFSPPVLPGNDLRQAALVVRQWLGLAETNDFHSYRAAVEARGIWVFRSNGYAGQWQIPKESSILGFSLYYPTCPVIGIKKLGAETRQTFTLMHELGHVLLHKSSSIDDREDMESSKGREREANVFAGYLLVPEAFLARIPDASRPDDVAQYESWLQPYTRAWGISAEVVLLRLLDTGRLTQRKYEGYCAWREETYKDKEDSGGTRLYRHREPMHLFGDSFVRTVLDALYAREITLTRASSYLDNLTIPNLHKLEQYYAGV